MDQLQYTETTTENYHSHQSTKTAMVSQVTDNEYNCLDGFFWTPAATTFATLLFGLLVVNIISIITCSWCICKKWKKKNREPTCNKLEVQDNPCYGPLGKRQNPDTDLHMYDIVHV